ncbi:MAG: FecR family protein [Lachnospiraceae bacterium]|nr:FecR family protein [Lachnospiraceae bacterium]
MKNRHIVTRFLAMTGIILSLLATTVPAQAAEGTAYQGMRLSKTQGIVAVFDTVNKPQKATNNMKLLSGYNIATSAASYAWINLDDNKLIKMDALSKVEFTSTGKNHVVDVTLGKAFFDISKDLEKDESLIIRTKSMVASINKGTSAEISIENGNTTIVGLDGKIDCVVVDVTTGQLKPVEVLSGKKVELKPTDSGISVVTKAVKKDDISGFSKLQIAQNPVLKDRVIKTTGSKIGNISVEEAVTSVSQDMVKQVTEVMAVAKESGKDVQSVINAMVGADISAKTLENVGTVTQSAPSSATSSDSSNDSTSDSGVPVHTHSWDEGVVTKAATCVEDGIRTLTCTGCHQTKEETIPAAHTLVGPEIEKDVTEGTPYNCEELIIAIYKRCDKCGQDIEQSTRNRYAEHDWGEWVQVKPPTCTEAGIRQYYCTRVLDTDAGRACTRFKEVLEPDSKGHTLGDDAIPSTKEADPLYIHCAESDCNYSAEYKWTEGKGYVLDGWVRE